MSDDADRLPTDQPSGCCPTCGAPEGRPCSAYCEAPR